MCIYVSSYNNMHCTCVQISTCVSYDTCCICKTIITANVVIIIAYIYACCIIRLRYMHVIIITPYSLSLCSAPLIGQGLIFCMQ